MAEVQKLFFDRFISLLKQFLISEKSARAAVKQGHKYSAELFIPSESQKWCSETYYKFSFFLQIKKEIEATVLWEFICVCNVSFLLLHFRNFCGVLLLKTAAKLNLW